MQIVIYFSRIDFLHYTGNYLRQAIQGKWPNKLDIDNAENFITILKSSNVSEIMIYFTKVEYGLFAVFYCFQ